MKVWTADGKLAFHKPTWQDMPTQYMIAGALADLEVKKVLGTRIAHTIGSKSLDDMKLLS